MVASVRFVAQNPGVTDVPTNGRRPRAPEAGPRSGPPVPAISVPELPEVDEPDLLAALGSPDGSAPQVPFACGPVGTGGAGPVTDDDRNRFGILLDHAAERGLLDPHEYEARLRELAGASSVEQMRQIVTELPMLTSPPVPAIRFGGRVREPLLPRGGGSAGTGDSRRSSPWLVLIVLVVVVVAALAFFVVYGDHIVRSRTSGLAVRSLLPPVSVLGS